mgnify:CR=1 FL=1
MIGSYWPHLLAVAVGASLTLQIGMNATLGRVVGSPLAYQGILASSHGAGPATFSFGDVVRASGRTSTPLAAATLPKTTLLGGAKSGRSWDGTVRP